MSLILPVLYLYNIHFLYLSFLKQFLCEGTVPYVRMTVNNQSTSTDSNSAWPNGLHSVAQAILLNKVFWCLQTRTLLGQGCNSRYSVWSLCFHFPYWRKISEQFVLSVSNRNCPVTCELGDGGSWKKLSSSFKSFSNLTNFSPLDDRTAGRRRRSSRKSIWFIFPLLITSRTFLLLSSALWFLSPSWR